MLAGKIRPLALFRSPRLSRAAAFRAQGVSLKYATSSWSGVRADDGKVVFAIRAEDVIADAEGSRCLLWREDDRQEAPARYERRRHCQLALLHGEADALLAHGDAAQMDAGVVLAIRVEVFDAQYWATWGSRLRQSSSQRHALPGNEACTRTVATALA